MKSSVFALLACTFLCWAGCNNQADVEIAGLETYDLQLPPNLPKASLPATNMLTKAGVALGRKLFYDPILSSDSTQSCASCHKQIFAFADGGNALSKGVKGKTGSRNAMPLFNLMWAPSYFWDGRAATLHQQIFFPIQDSLEMNETLENVLVKLQRSAFYRQEFKKAFGNEDVSVEKIGFALEQFLLTLISGNSKFDKYLRGEIALADDELRGMKLFNSEPNLSGQSGGADCFHCHGNSLLTNGQFANNGLDSIFTDPGFGRQTGKQKDYGKFKVPSLRNIAVTAPYMHDGRFATLEDVLEFYTGHVILSKTIDPNMHAMQNGLRLTSTEKADLLAFLNTLTDTEFLKNPQFSSPFK